jgi:hypothetical protein
MFVPVSFPDDLIDVGSLGVMRCFCFRWDERESCPRRRHENCEIAEKENHPMLSRSLPMSVSISTLARPARRIRFPKKAARDFKQQADTLGLR